MKSSPLDLAIAARMKGYSMIPLRGGLPEAEDYKRPMISWEKYQSTPCGIPELRSWRTNTYGIVTGPISKLFVVDVDQIESAMLGTVAVRTRRGWHFLFRWDDRLSNKVTTKTEIGEKMDIRGHGGYIVAWDLENLPYPSQLPPVPDWVIEKLPNKVNKTDSVPQQVSPTNQDWLSEALSGLHSGNRNDTFTRVAGSLRSRGYQTDVVFEFLKGKAKEVDFSEGELLTICKSVERYPLGQQTNISSNGESIDSFLEQIEAVEWICEPLVAKKSIGFVAGLPETKKTWLLMDLAIECARPGSQSLWLGKFPVTGARVLFIDQERFKGETQRRFKAILKGKGLDSKQLKDRLFIRSGTTTRLDLMPSFEAFRKEVAEVRPDLIIVDSFVTFHNSDENNRQTIQMVLERVKQLRNEFGCTFIFIDHESKGAFHDQREEEPASAMRMAGSIAKPAAAEFVLTVRRTDEDSSMCFHTKSTLASTVTPFSVKVVGTDSITVEAY